VNHALCAKQKFSGHYELLILGFHILFGGREWKIWIF